MTAEPHTATALLWAQGHAVGDTVLADGLPGVLAAVAPDLPAPASARRAQRVLEGYRTRAQLTLISAATDAGLSWSRLTAEEIRALDEGQVHWSLAGAEWQAPVPLVLVRPIYEPFDPPVCGRTSVIILDPRSSRRAVASLLLAFCRTRGLVGIRQIEAVDGPPVSTTSVGCRCASCTH